MAAQSSKSSIWSKNWLFSLRLDREIEEKLSWRVFFCIRKYTKNNATNCKTICYIIFSLQRSHIMNIKGWLRGYSIDVKRIVYRNIWTNTTSGLIEDVF